MTENAPAREQLTAAVDAANDQNTADDTFDFEAYGLVRPPAQPHGPDPELSEYLTTPARPVTEVARTPTSRELYGAAFEDNLVGSLLYSKSLRESIIPTDTTPLTDDELSELIVRDGLGQYADRFLDISTVGQYQALRSDIERELENDQIFAAAGTGQALAAGLVAGLVDLPTLIPFGHALRLGLAAKGAYSTLGTAGRLAGTAALDATVTEAGLHSIQQTRTVEESLANVGGSILLTTALGTAFTKAMQAGTFKRLGDRFSLALEDLRTGKTDAAIEGAKTKMLETARRAVNGELVQSAGNQVRGGNPYDGAVGGSKVRDVLEDEPWDAAAGRMTPDQLALADTLGVAGAAKRIQNSFLFGGNITLNMVTAKAHSAREFIANLTRIPIELKGNAEGVNTPQSAASMRATLDGAHATTTREFMDAYKAFRKGLDLSGKDLARFSRLVAYANANGDRAPAWMSKNDRADIAGSDDGPAGMTAAEWRELSSPERAAIEKAAKATRTFFTQIAVANIRAGLLRRFVVEKPGTATRAGPTVDARDSAETGSSIQANKDATAVAATKPTNHDPASFSDPQTFLKHIFRRERLIHDEHEFVRLEARAWLQNWQKLNNRSAASLQGAARNQLFRKAFTHAQGAYRAIIHGVDSEGQRAAGTAGRSNRRGSVLERNVLMPTSELLKRGWIEDDVLLLMSKALRENGTDAMLAMRFRREPSVAERNLAANRDPSAYWLDGDDPTSVPDLDMSEPKRRIFQEYEALIAEAKTDKERIALRKEAEQMLRHTEDAVSILRGRYKPEAHLSPSGRSLAVVREWTFASKMGSVVLSSLPDAGLHVLQHGPFNVARYALRRAGQRAHELFDGASERSIARIRREARAASVAIETENLARVSGYADIADPFSQGWTVSPFERFSKNLVHMSSRVFGVAYWNNMMQRISYGIFQDRVIRIAHNPASASKADRRWLAHFGIADREFLDAVKASVLKQADGGQERGGLFFAEASEWDAKTRDRFFTAARDSARSSVLLPEMLEKPLHSQGPVGSTLLQFTGYVFASTLRVTAQTAARLKIGDASERASIATGIAAIMAASAVSIYLKFLAADRLADLPDFEEHRGWWAYETLDRSGLLGLFTHLGNISENIGFVSPRGGLEALFGDEERKQYRPQSPAAALAGPLGSTARDASHVIRDVAVPGQEVDARTVSAARRLTPIVNAFWLRRIFTDPAERFLDEEVLGVPAEK